MSKKLKRGELRVYEVQFSKAEFAALPEAERIHYFMLAQAANELAMLRTLTIQSLNGVVGPRAVREANLGMAFMLARLTAGRLHEAWELAGKQSVLDQLRAMTEELKSSNFVEALRSAEASRNALNEFFSNPANPLTRVRKKLAFHQDRAPVVAAFDMFTDEFDPVDFHTGARGTTFYGFADTLAAIAASHVIGTADPHAGTNEIINRSIAISSEMEAFIDGYLSAFCILHFGAERFGKKSVILRERPSITRARAHFFLDPSRVGKDEVWYQE